MKRVIKVALILIPYLLLGALVVAGVVVMEIPVTQKSIDLLEKGMTFSEVFEVLKRDIVITPISAEDAAKVEYDMYPVNLINILGEDYEIDSWGGYTIYEWQMEDGESFMVFIGGLGVHDRHKVTRYWTTRSEWERQRSEGREFDESKESIRMEYLYIYGINEDGFVASLDGYGTVFFEYYEADKFFYQCNSVAVYFDEDTLQNIEGTFETRDGKKTYNAKVRAYSTRFTDPRKGEPMFG